MPPATAIQRLVNALAEREGREHAAKMLAHAIGAEALLILVRDPETSAIIPAPGFSRTLPGGPSWRAFLAACARPGQFMMEVEHPDSHGRKIVRASVSADGAVTAVIGGVPDIEAFELSKQLLPIIRLLQSEFEVISARGAAAVAAMANQQASALAATIDEARRRLAEQANQLRSALDEAARLNNELTELTHTLEQRVEMALADR